MSRHGKYLAEALIRGRALPRGFGCCFDESSSNGDDSRLSLGVSVKPGTALHRKAVNRINDLHQKGVRYTVSGGLSRYYVASRLVQELGEYGLTAEIYENGRISRGTLDQMVVPVHVLREITNYANFETILNLGCCSRDTRNAIEKQYLESKLDFIAKYREDHVLPDYEIEYDCGVEKWEVIGYLVVNKLPEPELPYGVPDLDIHGSIIWENFVSNNEWEKVKKLVEDPDIFLGLEQEEHLLFLSVETDFSIETLRTISWRHVYQPKLVDLLLTVKSPNKHMIKFFCEHHPELESSRGGVAALRKLLN